MTTTAVPAVPALPTPEPVDVSTWPRLEAWNHYRQTSPCSYSITTELDVTELRRALSGGGRKTYPAQIWALAATVDTHPAFRMALAADGGPAVWPQLHPMFTVLNPERETFAAAWTPFDADFGRFHDRVAELLAQHRTSTRMFPQDDIPPNVFDVSSLPWTAFTSFSLHLPHGHEHLLPIFTLGRYVERDGRTLLPLATQIHHAAADGLQTARFLTDLQELLAAPDRFGL